MPLTSAKKVAATGAIAVGVVLGAAGITAAATAPGADPTPGPVATSLQHADNNNDNVDFTPASEQGKAEVADTGEAADTPEAGETPDVTTTSPTTQG